MPRSHSGIQFPSSFLWGTATSAHQVDGGNTNNNWWEWTHQVGTVTPRAGIACDHWNRFDEDFTILDSLNQNAYRFSMEWSRILPARGVVSHEVIEHYHRVIAALKERQIEPFVTLHHFTEPLWFTKLGGLQRERNVKFFREYVEVVAREFSDEITFWTTINEPNLRAACGYFQGIHPPGEKGIRNYIKSLRNLIRMHAEAYQVLKQHTPHNMVGLVKNITVIEPYRPRSWIDVQFSWLVDYLVNAVTLRALKTGKLPFSFMQEYSGLKDSSDFIGLNYYTHVLCSLTLPEYMKAYRDQVDPSKLCVGLGWEAYPEGLLVALKRVWNELRIPIYITENGIGTDNDTWRQQYIAQHLHQVHEALGQGIPVKGYFYWSLLDNFEWAEGYSSRFGLVACDRDSLMRQIKRSGYWYGEIAQNNRLSSPSAQP
jgi:beta-glucosidase